MPEILCLLPGLDGSTKSKDGYTRPVWLNEILAVIVLAALVAVGLADIVIGCGVIAA